MDGGGYSPPPLPTLLLVAIGHNIYVLAGKTELNYEDKELALKTGAEKSEDIACDVLEKHGAAEPEGSLFKIGKLCRADDRAFFKGY